MDSAHCATDPLRLKPNQNGDQIQKLKEEMSKMKEDYERKIQVLNYEHQIKVLEFEKTLSEKDNIIQTMKHQREIEKLKMEQKEFEVKSKMTDNGDENEVARFQECDNKITLNDAKLAMIDAKVVEINNQSVEKDNKIIQLKTEIDAKLAMIDAKVVEINNQSVEKDNKIIQLKTKIDGFENKLAAMKVEIIQKMEANKDDLVAIQRKIGTSIDELPEMESLIWGAGKFMEGLVVKKLNPAPSYKQWYEHISSFMTNGKLYYDNAKYFFCRKEMDQRFGEIFFTSERIKRERWWGHVCIVVDEFHNDLWNKGKVWLLHPTDQSNILEILKNRTETNYDSWYSGKGNVDGHFYYGDKDSVIVFGMIK
eukprot:TCONS_00016071-protein